MKRHSLLAAGRDIRDAIRGVPHDYTQGSLGRALFLLAVPMVLEMFMQSLFAVADAYFVGRLGPAAVATVGIAEGLLMIVIAVAIGLSVGATATVAQRIGEKDENGARDAAGQAILLGVFMAALLGGLGAAFAPQLMSLMGARPDVMEVGQGYTRHLLGGSGTILLLFLINAAFRGAGDPSLAFRSLALANLLNIVLDPIFIFGWGPIPAMGVTGAAVATNIGRGAGIVYQLTVLFRGRSRLRLNATHFRILPKTMIGLVRVSSVGIFQFFINTTSYTGLIIVITAYASEAVAGLTIAVRVIMFVLLPAWGLGNAAATLMGQNLGAGQPDRANRSVWAAAHANMVFLAAVSAVFLLFPETIVSWFSEDPDVIRHGGMCLKLISLCYIPMAYGLTTLQAFNGAGDTWTPTYVAFFAHWLLKLPLAWGLASLAGLGPTGVFVAVPVAEVVAAAAGVALFRRGRWRHQKI